MAERIGRWLKEDGFGVVLQQWDFHNRNFVDAMDAMLRSDARVVTFRTS
jgi:hypothetical protein